MLIFKYKCHSELNKNMFRRRKKQSANNLLFFFKDSPNPEAEDEFDSTIVRLPCLSIE